MKAPNIALANLKSTVDGKRSDLLQQKALLVRRGHKSTIAKWERVGK